MCKSLCLEIRYRKLCDCRDVFAANTAPPAPVRTIQVSLCTLPVSVSCSVSWYCFLCVMCVIRASLRRFIAACFYYIRGVSFKSYTAGILLFIVFSCNTPFSGVNKRLHSVPNPRALFRLRLGLHPPYFHPKKRQKRG